LIAYSRDAFLAERLHVAVGVSLRHGALILSVHLMAAGAMLLHSGLTAELRAALGLALVVSLINALDSQVLPWSRSKVNAIACSGSGWRLALPDGSWQSAELTGQVMISRWFIVARFRYDAGTRDVVIARDTMDADSFRRCKAFFRLRRYQPNDGGVSTVSSMRVESAG
jgi:hypothetical protein